MRMRIYRCPTPPYPTLVSIAPTTTTTMSIQTYEPYSWDANPPRPHSDPDLDTKVRTTFYHPGHPDVKLGFPLFSFGAIDMLVQDPIAQSTGESSQNTNESTSATALSGLHYGTAITACAIIACNKPGYLTETRDGPRVEATWDSILSRPEYWYHVENEPNYPICVTFAEWRFPEAIPAEWVCLSKPAGNPYYLQQEADRYFQTALIGAADTSHVAPSHMTEAVLVRDHGKCCVSGSTYSLQSAHVVPIDQKDWYVWNHMFEYSRSAELGTGGIHDVANGISLRGDIRTAWDSRTLAFVPKVSLTPVNDPTHAIVHYS